MMFDDEKQDMSENNRWESILIVSPFSALHAIEYSTPSSALFILNQYLSHFPFSLFSFRLVSLFLFINLWKSIVR